MSITPGIFNITKKPRLYEGAQRYEHHSYEPDNTANINKTGDITINITNMDTMYYPADSYLLFVGRLTMAKAAGVGDAATDKYKKTDKITLINNGLMFLFSSYRYQLSAKDVLKYILPRSS